MINAMPTFAIYLNRELQGYVAAVSLRQAKERARKRYGRRVDVIGSIRETERYDAQNRVSQSRVGPAVL